MHLNNFYLLFIINPSQIIIVMILIVDIIPHTLIDIIYHNLPHTKQIFGPHGEVDPEAVQHVQAPSASTLLEVR